MKINKGININGGDRLYSHSNCWTFTLRTLTALSAQYLFTQMPKWSPFPSFLVRKCLLWCWNSIHKKNKTKLLNSFQVARQQSFLENSSPAIDTVPPAGLQQDHITLAGDCLSTSRKNKPCLKVPLLSNVEITSCWIWFQWLTVNRLTLCC